MPIYEYRCRDCGRGASLFFRSMSTATEPACPHCGSRRLDKLMSPVALRRGHRAEHEGTAADSSQFNDGWDDPAANTHDPFGAGMIDDDADPRELASWTRRMSRQMGEPLDADLDRALSDIERGADPDEALDRQDESPPPDPEG